MGRIYVNGLSNIIKKNEMDILCSRCYLAANAVVFFFMARCGEGAQSRLVLPRPRDCDLGCVEGARLAVLGRRRKILAAFGRIQF